MFFLLQICEGISSPWLTMAFAFAFTSIGPWIDSIAQFAFGHLEATAARFPACLLFCHIRIPGIWNLSFSHLATINVFKGTPGG